MAKASQKKTTTKRVVRRTKQRVKVVRRGSSKTKRK